MCATSASAARWSAQSFFVIIGLVSAVGTALVYGFGGYLVIQDVFTVGTIVAFGAYLGSLYGALQGWPTRPVEFATSMVSFERVFEVIDLPHGYRRKAGCASCCKTCTANWNSKMSPSAMTIDDKILLQRSQPLWADGQTCTAVLSRTTARRRTASNGEARARRSDPQKRELIHIQAREVALEEISFTRRARAAGRAGRSQRGGQDHAHLSDPAPVRPHQRGASCIDGHDLRDVTLDSLSRADRHGDAGDAISSTTPSAPTCSTPGWTPPRPRSKPPRAPPTSTTSSWTCPMATTPSSASAATA